MKKLIYVVIMFFLVVSVSFSQGWGVGGGVSYLASSDLTNNSFGFNLIDKDALPGFNINLRLKVDFGILAYTLNAGWNKFVVSNVEFTPPYGNTEGPSNFTLSQNIFPFTTGVQINVIGPESGIFNIYAGGEISYSIISNSLDNGGQPGLPLTVVFEDAPRHRFGACPVAGIEFILGQVTWDVSMRFHFMNIVNRPIGEELASYFMINASVFFSNR